MKTYSVWQRILGFCCALAILILLAACGAAANRGKAAQTDAPAGTKEEVPTEPAPANTAAPTEPAPADTGSPAETAAPETDAPAVSPLAPDVEIASRAPGSEPTYAALDPEHGFAFPAGEYKDAWTYTDGEYGSGTVAGEIRNASEGEAEGPDAEPAPDDPIPVPSDPTLVSDDPPVEPVEPIEPEVEPFDPVELEPEPIDIDDPVEPVEPVDPYVPDPGEAFVLTAAEWNDNDNWPFFTNLVTGGRISFPAFGVDPRNRVKVSLQDENGAPLPYETVTLLDEAGNVLWTAKTAADGVAYLFFKEDEVPARVSSAGATGELVVSVPDEGGQGTSTITRVDELTLQGTAGAAAKTALQVMFIVDTTGSMGDELSYLQKDFSAIAADVGIDGVSYSACFYRDEGDEYVTRCNGFTSDLAEVQRLINSEYADGGGDTPEAVHQILTETMNPGIGWRDDCVKIAFLIFDAPPHEGNEAALDAAVRSAAEQGIHLIPVVASNADRETELFGRAIAICTDGTYIFLTDDSGVGGSHLEPIVGSYEVELLHDVIVRVIEGYRP